MKRNVNKRVYICMYIRTVEAKFVHDVVKINSIQWLNSQSYVMEWPKPIQFFLQNILSRDF